MSAYTEKLDEICRWIKSNPGTGGARALRKLVMDLEGDGPVGELLHSVDDELFQKAISLLIEFRKTGRYEPYNSIHAKARNSI